MNKHEVYRKRFLGLYSIIGVMTLLLLGRLFMLQIIDGESYSAITERRLVKTMPQKAPRGEILDRYGRPLVSNRMGYTIQIAKTAETDEELNQIILNLIQICEQEQIDYYDDLPLTPDMPFSYIYYGETQEEIDKQIAAYHKALGLTEILSAPELFQKLKEKYKISEDYSTVNQRKIMGVRAEMQQRLFSKQNAYTFASDVNMNIVTKIKENTVPLKGVNIMVEYMREYNEPNVASHILGRIGPIYQEEYKELSGKGYSINDVVGKDGIEKYCESLLKGKDGTYKIEEDESGHIISTSSSVNAVPGNDVVLTIDLELQKTAERMLQEVINTIRANARYQPKNEGHDADSGAVVVTDIHTGEVLALASYPTYDLSRYNETYGENYKNPAKPMWNRAISGIYEPGSTFKMVTAIAGLEAGVITDDTIMNCTGSYRYYAPNYTPSCWKKSGHGNLDVAGAIKHSCNVFFYETGRLLTISRLNDFTRRFGLGDFTGIELSGEAKGIIAGPEYVEKLGEKWWPGDTIQAAIGQSKNLFTPIQLANYIGTLANGGTRYKTHLVKKVKEYSSSNIIEEVLPEAVDTIRIGPRNYQMVMEGMRSVTEDGTASNVFRNFEVSVGGKTGTAEVSKGSNNGIFVAFAPFENPQIAISVIVEHGAHGNTIAPVAKEIIRQYFTGDFLEYDDKKIQMEVIK